MYQCQAKIELKRITTSRQSFGNYFAVLNLARVAARTYVDERSVGSKCSGVLGYSEPANGRVSFAPCSAEIKARLQKVITQERGLT